jgi:hypothetical protein
MYATGEVIDFKGTGKAPGKAFLMISLSHWCWIHFDCFSQLIGVFSFISFEGDGGTKEGSTDTIKEVEEGKGETKALPASSDLLVINSTPGDKLEICPFTLFVI